MILDGKIARDFYKSKLIEKIQGLSDTLTLAIIQIGHNPESTTYINQKKKFGKEIGVEVLYIHLEEKVSSKEIEILIEKLNTDKKIDGVIIQLPLPIGFDKKALTNKIDSKKDIDGLKDNSKFTPATAKGVFLLLDFYNISVQGKNVVVIGRSSLVGHPLAELLKKKGANVTVCHSQTPNTKEISRSSDMVFVAIGKAKFIDSSYIKEGATVIDIGINKSQENKIIGDVDFDDVLPHVKAITRVPGGIGPMTVLALFENLFETTSL